MEVDGEYSVLFSQFITLFHILEFAYSVRPTPCSGYVDSFEVCGGREMWRRTSAGKKRGVEEERCGGREVWRKRGVEEERCGGRGAILFYPVK